ncbi:nucleoside deaminase, partial [Clostridium botulinum]|nr:nucleoside deaminase [Clostridium botulinum]
MDKNEIMDLCVKSCMEGMKNHEGGPFGSAIVKDGEVIAVAHNTV